MSNLKKNWFESRNRYSAWWEQKGLLISMWDYVYDKQPENESKRIVSHFENLLDCNNPSLRANKIDKLLPDLYFGADIIPVADTHLGPGSLAAILGSKLKISADSIWFDPKMDDPELIKPLKFDPNHPNWLLHYQLISELRKFSNGKYWIGCPDLVENLDIIVSLRGTDETLCDLLVRPDWIKEKINEVNKAFFEVHNLIYDLIKDEDGGMAWCYFSLWAPGKMAKLQCDTSIMLSEEQFIEFVLPGIQEQCKKIPYTLYHLDGVDAIRHLDSLLSIPDLNAIQWSPGIGQPQGGDPKWFPFYKRILDAGKSVLAVWVKPHEVKPFLKVLGFNGIHLLIDCNTPEDIENILSDKEIKSIYS